MSASCPRGDLRAAMNAGGLTNTRVCIDRLGAFGLPNPLGLITSYRAIFCKLFRSHQFPAPDKAGTHGANLAMAFNRFFQSNPARMPAASPSMSSPSPIAPTTPPAAPSTGPRKRQHDEGKPDLPQSRTVRQKLFASVGDTDRSIQIVTVAVQWSVY